jgi:hypothetical protein
MHDQCTVVGLCRNWHILFTAKARSGRVRVKYCKAPTMLLYRVPSSGDNSTPSLHDNLSEAGNGVGVSLQFFIPTLVKILDAYFSCDSRRPPWVRLTSMPRK